MAGMKDRLTLVSEAIDPEDPHQRVTRTERNVYADMRPLHAGEFHAAAARGFELQHIMLVRASEYQEERIGIYRSKEYSIYRSYRRNEDWIELYLNTRGATST